MKSIRIYLLMVGALFLTGIFVSVYVWYTVQKIDTEAHDIFPVASTTVPGTRIAPPSVIDTRRASSSVVEPVVIHTDTISDSQRSLLKTFGFNGSTITFTKEMISCAEGALGKIRLNEIISGNAPSAPESVKLLPCIQK